VIVRHTADAPHTTTCLINA